MTEPSSLELRPAGAADWPAVAALLEANGLPLAGARDHLSDFVLAWRAGTLVGCAGLERHGEAALLRSVAARAEARGQGIGRRLVEAALQHARAGGTRQVVLLTETARDYFPRFGFRLISRAEAPTAVRASAEFTGACPESATVMMLDFDERRSNPHRIESASNSANSREWDRGDVIWP